MLNIIKSERSFITKWAALLFVSVLITIVLGILFFPFIQIVKIRVTIISLPTADYIIGVKIASHNFIANHVDSGENAKLCADDYPCYEYGFMNCKLLTNINGGLEKDSIVYLRLPAGMMSSRHYLIAYKSGSDAYITFCISRTGLYYKFLI